MSKMLMPYLQCFRLRCQEDLCSVSWNTHPNRQYIEVINELTRCCNSSISSANNNSLFIQACAVAVSGGCLDREQMYACIWHMPNVFHYCAMPHPRCERTGRVSYVNVCLQQHIFLPNTIVSGLVNFVFDTKYCLFGVKCPVAPLSQYQLHASTMFALEAPIACTRNAPAFFFAADLPPLSPACCCFWGQSAAQWPSCLHCCKEISVLRDQLLFSWIYMNSLRRIRLLLVIFMCNERRRFSWCQFVSSQLNCTELLNEEIYRLFARMNGNQHILENVVFRTKCGQNSTSQHTFRQRIFTAFRQFVV